MAIKLVKQMRFNQRVPRFTLECLVLGMLYCLYFKKMAWLYRTRRSELHVKVLVVYNAIACDRLNAKIVNFMLSLTFESYITLLTTPPCFLLALFPEYLRFPHAVPPPHPPKGLALPL